MNILEFVCLTNDIIKAQTQDVLEGDNQNIIWGLMILQFVIGWIILSNPKPKRYLREMIKKLDPLWTKASKVKRYRVFRVKPHTLSEYFMNEYWSETWQNHKQFYSQYGVNLRIFVVCLYYTCCSVFYILRNFAFDCQRDVAHPFEMG